MNGKKSASPYLHINRIEFIVTYQCTGNCMHCSLGDRLNRPAAHPHVEKEAAAAAVAKLAEYFPVTSVMTFGGEPLLYPDVVCAIHEAARGCGIGKRQIITNGFFSKEEKRINQVAAALKDAGVNNLLLSVDAFHQRTIPLEPVRRFAEAVKDVGLEKVQLQPAWLVNREHENEYNVKTRELLAEFADLQIPVNDGNDIFLSGNAAKYLTFYYDAPRLDLSQKCSEAPYTEALTDVSTLSIVPNGDVMVCGFVIGNIYEDTVEEIVSGYDPYQKEAMRAVVTGGVLGLMALAGEKGIAADCAGCYSACDVCRRIVGELNRK